MNVENKYDPLSHSQTLRLHIRFLPNRFHLLADNTQNDISLLMEQKVLLYR